MQKSILTQDVVASTIMSYLPATKVLRYASRTCKAWNAVHRQTIASTFLTQLKNLYFNDYRMNNNMPELRNLWNDDFNVHVD